jgi:hypothetical protein
MASSGRGAHVREPPRSASRRLHPVYAPKQAVRIDAIRADRAAGEFRGLPPSAREELTRELGDRIVVQTSDWNCNAVITPNHKHKPSTMRGCAARSPSTSGAAALSRVANVRTVGGIVFPGSPVAATKAELETLAGYWPDIDKSRAQGGRRRGPQVRAAQPQRRPALRRYLGDRRMEQGKSRHRPLYSFCRLGPSASFAMLS